MAKEHILIVEDEDDIRELIRYNLSREGYTVTEAASGEDGLRRVGESRPDLIVLDLMLPGIDGFGVCRTLKGDKATAEIPIVIVTAKGEEPDIVTGLELGADDYITKPFSPRVLIARVRAVLRRKIGDGVVPEEDAVIERDGLRIHPGRHEVRIDGEAADLTYTEFKILHLLARRPGWVFTWYQIVDAVRGDDHPVSDRSVDVQIVGLRKKLGRCADLVETVRGVGYRFKE
jgi:two-component system phosphate regulon response regulator PhoB